MCPLHLKMFIFLSEMNNNCKDFFLLYYLMRFSYKFSYFGQIIFWLVISYYNTNFNLNHFITLKKSSVFNSDFGVGLR